MKPKMLNQVLLSLFSKLVELLSSVWGWVISILLVVTNYFAGYKFICVVVAVVVIMDACWGIAAALKQRKFACSELMRSTFVKFSAYATAVVLAIFMEDVSSMETTICSAIVAAGICATELWSIAGNILIVEPDIPFFKILRPALRGEIARKLGISEDEVDEALSSNTK